MGVGEWRPCDDRARRCAAAGASQDVEMGCGGLTCGTPTVEEPRWPIRRARGRNTESVVCAPRGGGLWKREGDDGRLGAGPRADGEKGGGGANTNRSKHDVFGAGSDSVPRTTNLETLASSSEVPVPPRPLILPWLNEGD